MSAYIPRFKNVTEQSKYFLRGYHYGLSAHRGREQHDAIIGALKEALTEPGGWGIGMYAFGECSPYQDNRMTLNQDKKDVWGRPMITFDCSFKENEQADA